MRRRKDNLFRLLRDTLWGEPTVVAFKRVEEAMKDKAKHVSDAEFNRTMTDFYTDQVKDIDHEHDWWRYAEAKQKEFDHHEAWLAAKSRAVEAETKIAAERQRFSSIMGYSAATEPAAAREGDTP